MTEKITPTSPQIKPLASISKIWILPAVALFVGAWMIFFQINSKGPLITIDFETAEGIVAGKTKVKIKNVDVGIIEKIELNDDFDTVSITARINKANRNLLGEDTDFWVVRPRIGKDGISGLGTILSGAYIELSPGTSQQKKYDFIGLSGKPITPSGTRGLHISLESSAFRSLQVGDQILFHGIEVGRIEYTYFNTDERKVYYNTFIESPYDELITTNTRFWEINGVEVELSADGIHIETGTIETLISGGVTFDIPENTAKGDPVTERTLFTIYPNKNAIHENKHQYALSYILLFQDSIRGLSPGAAVEYRGVKIGKVSRTDIAYPEINNLLDRSTLIPVLISIEPGRIGFADSVAGLEQLKLSLRKLVQQGLRGQLATGNLLTGKKYIELHYDQTLDQPLQNFSSYTVIPTIRNQLDQIVNKVNRLMDKIQQLPLEKVVESTDESLQQFTSTLKQFNNADKTLDQLTSTLNAFENSDETLQQLTLTLKAFQDSSQQLTSLLRQSSESNLVASIKTSLGNIDSIINDFSAGSMTHDELQKTIEYMKKTLQQLEPLLSQLNRKPNSLIFSNSKHSDIEPKGKPQ